MQGFVGQNGPRSTHIVSRIGRDAISAAISKGGREIWGGDVRFWGQFQFAVIPLLTNFFNTPWVGHSHECWKDLNEQFPVEKHWLFAGGGYCNDSKPQPIGSCWWSGPPIWVPLSALLFQARFL